MKETAVNAIHRLVLGGCLITLLVATPGAAAPKPGALACGCDYSEIPGAVWWGNPREITVAELAAYAAPIIWFSPDEPSLGNAHGTAITTPDPFPFQDLTGPVLYYQLKEVVKNGEVAEPAYTLAGTDPGDAVVDLEVSALFLLEYYAYYKDEAGFSSHQHDVEPVEMRIGVARSNGEYLRHLDMPQCSERHVVIIVNKITGKAHGIEWFWNILEVKDEAAFPMTVLVEEGKHAMAPDRNGDGYFTPSYDVNVRVNDAWGVRDIIRSGGLFTAGYQAWMTKVRNPEDRVLPPLPLDSPLTEYLQMQHQDYTRGNAVYQLLPLPTVSEAAAWDEEQGEHSHLQNYLLGKSMPDGPDEKAISSLGEALSWIDAGTFKKSLSIAAYADGRWGFSWTFPLFIGKNMTVPMTGGYIMNRMYLKGYDLKDFGWTALYTSSASRWVDSYIAAGVEWHDVDLGGVTSHKADFVVDTGLKFRTQIGHSPLRFLSFITDFWGLRIGIKNYGFFDIDHLTYVMEIGAGAF